MAKFDSIEITTQNVMQELNKISKKEKVPLADLDFTILEAITYEKNKETNGEWISLDKGILKKLEDPEQAQDENVELRQDYLVRIFVGTDDYKNQFSELKRSLTANKQLTKVSLTIKGPFTLKNSPTFERDFVNFINKKKLKYNIFINVWEVGFRSKIADLYDKVKSQGELNIPKDLTFEISRGFEKVNTINDELRFLYKEKAEALKEDEYGNIDHSQKGFVITVEKGDVVIRYTKPKKGKIGRNCRGKIDKVAEPVENHRPVFKVSEKFEIIENDNHVNYVAKKTGTIIFKNDKYDIEDKVEVQALSFKDTGSVNAGIDSDVELTVKETNFQKDAVGTGVNVIASHLNIDGNVGESSKITAHDVHIGGQTHKTSHIIAEEAEIFIHKGHILSEFVQIERLEAGIVEAEKAQIKRAIGGEIRAREVHIDELESNIHIFASKSIIVEYLKGSENIFVVDLEGYRDGISEVQDTRQQFINIEQDINRLEGEIVKMELDAIESKHALLQLQKRLNRYRESKIEAPKSLTDKLEKHKETREKYSEFKKEFQRKIEKQERLKAKNEEFQTQLLDAKIEIRDTWKGHNIIKFKLVDPPITLEKRISEDSLENVFRIEKIKYEKDNYEIVSDVLDLAKIKADREKAEAELKAKLKAEAKAKAEAEKIAKAQQNN